MLFGRKQRELEDKIRAQETKIDELYTRLNDKNEQLMDLDEKVHVAHKEAKTREDDITKRARTGTFCIELLLQRGISWYDYSKLDHAGQLAYKNNAVAIINNETFQNEWQTAISDWVQEIAKKAEDFEQVMGLRMCINALQSFKERLEEIPSPPKTVEEVEEPFSNI